ncbi:MAG: nitroreductase family protein [Sarcina sp.]
MIDFLKTRRSIRKYKDISIEDEKIENILKAALLSPSSKGKRPWEFMIIKDRDLLKKMSKCRLKGGGPFLANAPLGIVVLGDMQLTDVWVEDCSIATTLMQLEAHELGLGSCWIQVRKRMHDDEVTAEEYLKNILNIPEKYGVLCILSIGYKDENRMEYEDRDLKFDKIHYGKF